MSIYNIYVSTLANSRLERLKQSLISQQQKQKQSSDTLNDTQTLNEQLNMSFERNNNTKLLHLEDHNPHNNSKSTLYHTANNTNDDGKFSYMNSCNFLF